MAWRSAKTKTTWAGNTFPLYPRACGMSTAGACWSGFRQSPRGNEKDPSPDLVPRPPSPLGEGCSLHGARPRTSIIALSLGERGDRKAVGEGSFRVSGYIHAT